MLKSFSGVADEADCRKRKSLEEISSDSSMEEIANNEKITSDTKGKKLRLTSVKEADILVSDSEPMVVDSDNESQKSGSNKESEKFESDEESDRSDSDKESGRSASDKESERSNSDEDSQKSNSDEESQKSNSDEESERSGSDEDSERSGSEEESERSGSDDESERSGSEEEESERSGSDDESEGSVSNKEDDSSEGCSSMSSSSDESANLSPMISACKDGSENSSRIETSEEEGSETSSKEESSAENSDNSTNIDSDNDSGSSSKDNDAESDNSSKDDIDDESEFLSRIDIDEVSETSSLSSEQESESSESSNHSLICEYMPFIEKQITKDTMVTPPDVIFGYICFGHHDSMMIEAFRKCEINVLLWSPTEDVPEEYLSGPNFEKAFDLEDFFVSSVVIVCYAEHGSEVTNFLLKKVDHDLFQGTQFINFTRTSPGESHTLRKAVRAKSGHYLEARIVKHLTMQDEPAHIYASGSNSAFNYGLILFKNIASLTHYCGEAIGQASLMSSIYSTLYGLSFGILSEVKQLTHAIVDKFSPQEVNDIFLDPDYQCVPKEISQIVFSEEASNSAQNIFCELNREVMSLRHHDESYELLAKKGGLQLDTINYYLSKYNTEINVEEPENV